MSHAVPSWRRAVGLPPGATKDQARGEAIRRWPEHAERFARKCDDGRSKAIIDALNVAYNETEKRSFVQLNLVALAFTLGAIFAFMIAISAVVAAPIVLSHLGLGGGVDALIRIARWPALMALVVLG